MSDLMQEQVDGFFAHMGVKGMKWGVRRDREIESSRARSQARLVEAKHAPTKAERKKKLDELLTSEDYLDNLNLTRGEAVATAILTGGLGNLSMALVRKGAQLDAAAAQKRLDADKYKEKYGDKK